MSTKNKIIIFTGPSGVGKATLENELFKDEELNLALSVSATTRNPRKGEIDGKSYHFISMDEFDAKISNDEFVEWSEHFSNKYGTLKSEIKRLQSLNKIPFLEVETVGAKNIVKKYSNDEIISIFIAPPSLEDLRKRIIKRGAETEEQIEQRLARVKMEMDDKDLFDYIIYNDVFEHALEELKKIIKRELF